MEIEIKPINLEDRVEYIKSISENQQKNNTGFPWKVATIALLLGGLTAYVIIQHKQDGKEEK